MSRAGPTWAQIHRCAARGRIGLQGGGTAAHAVPRGAGDQPPPGRGHQALRCLALARRARGLHHRGHHRGRATPARPREGDRGRSGGMPRVGRGGAVDGSAARPAPSQGALGPMRGWSSAIAAFLAGSDVAWSLNWATRMPRAFHSRRSRLSAVWPRTASSALAAVLRVMPCAVSCRLSWPRSSLPLRPSWAIPRQECLGRAGPAATRGTRRAAGGGPRGHATRRASHARPESTRDRVANVRAGRPR